MHKPINRPSSFVFGAARAPTTHHQSAPRWRAGRLHQLGLEIFDVAKAATNSKHESENMFIDRKELRYFLARFKAVFFDNFVTAVADEDAGAAWPRLASALSHLPAHLSLPSTFQMLANLRCLHATHGARVLPSSLSCTRLSFAPARQGS